MLSHYAAFAFRNWRRAPVVTAVNVLTLAIGLVCFLAAFAFVTFFERADRHFENADRVHVVTTSFTFFGGRFTRDQSTGTPAHLAAMLQADFPGIEAAARAFELDWQAQTSVAGGERAVRLYSVAVDPEFLEIFDLPFLAGDPRSALAAPRSVVLTRDSARQLFGDEDPIGESLRIRNRVDATVTGVIDELPEPSHMGRAASATLRFELLASLDVYEATRTELPGIALASAVNWTGEDAVTYVLLPRDGSLSSADLAAQLPAFAARHVPAETLATTRLSYGLIPTGDLLRKGVDTELFSGDIGVSVSTALLLLGSLVLLVACINYANLATAQAAGRTREVGLRKALGARPAQIMAQHLAEAALLSAAALLVAVIGLRLALPVLEGLSGLRLGATGFSFVEGAAFLVFVAVAVTLAAGAYPAFVLSRTGAYAAIRKPHGPGGAKRLAELLVGAQFAVASLLLIALSVIALQNARLERSGLGSASASLVLIENPSEVTRIEPATLRSALLELPQVEAVAEMGGLPWQRLVGVTTISRDPDPASAAHLALVRDVGHDFFQVLQLQLLAGRAFNSDDAAGQRNIVVDRAFIDELGYASPGEAVDQLVYYPPGGSGDRENDARRIIGVVETRRFSFRGAGAVATVYVLAYSPNVSLVRIATDDVPGALAGIDSVWRSLAPDVAINRRFMDELFDQAYEIFLSVQRALGGLALMTIFIATSGLFAMATLVAARRRPEIGVRKTFGASTPSIVAMLLRNFSRPVLIANLVSWPIAYVAARAYLSAFVDAIPLTLVPFAASLVVTLLIAWAAIGGQTLRAARTRPSRVLRQE